MSYLTFKEATRPGNYKTKFWSVHNAPVVLGVISWYSPWRRYCFSPASGTTFDAACLRELTEFCENRTEEHKA